MKTKKTNLSTYEKIIKRSIKQAKKHYYTDTFDNCKNDMKQTWKNINKILYRNSPRNDFPDLIIQNDKHNTSEKEILNALNTHFDTVGKAVADSITPISDSYSKYLTHPCNNRFIFTNIDKSITELTISKELKNKSSTGYDNISSKLLKSLKDQISEPLTFLIN